MKILLLFIINLIIINKCFSFNNINDGSNSDNIYTANFKLGQDCLSKPGCSIFSNSSYWDNSNGFNSPSETLFIITYSTETNSTVYLNIDQPIIIGGLQIDFSESETITHINVSSNLQATGSIITTYSSISINNNAIVSANTINFIGSTIQLYGSSQLRSTQKPLDPSQPDFIVNDESLVSCYDTSTVQSNHLFLKSSLNLFDESILQINVFLETQNGFHTSNGSSIRAQYARILLSGGNQKFIFLGSIVSNIIEINSSTQVDLSNTDTQELILQPLSQLTILPNSIVHSRENIQIDGNVTVGTGSTFYALSNDGTVTVNGVITLTDNTNLFVSNIAFPSNSLISSTSSNKIYTNVTIINNGTAELLDSFDIVGAITITEGATLTQVNELFTELCIYVYGNAFIASRLICNNDNLLIQQSGNLYLGEGAHIYYYLLNNYGVLNITGPKVTAQGNIFSWGAMVIDIDCNVEVLGYVDLYSNSSLIIEGLGPNTAAALFVRDILTINGLFAYNISIPPSDKDSVYTFIESNIQIDGNFTEYVPDNDLINLPMVFDFITPKGYNYPDTIQVVFNWAKPEHHIHPVLILIAIVSPLIVIGILVIGVYKFKQYKQRQGYISLSSNDKILNDPSFNLN